MSLGRTPRSPALYNSSTTLQMKPRFSSVSHVSSQLVHLSTASTFRATMKSIFFSTLNCTFAHDNQLTKLAYLRRRQICYLVVFSLPLLTALEQLFQKYMIEKREKRKPQALKPEDLEAVCYMFLSRQDSKDITLET